MKNNWHGVMNAWLPNILNAFHEFTPTSLPEIQDVATPNLSSFIPPTPPPPPPTPHPRSTFDRRFHKSNKHFSYSFSDFAPVLWNSFPFQIRNSPSVTSFKKHLKTRLFNFSFPFGHTQNSGPLTLTALECPYDKFILLTSALSSPLWGRF